MNDMRKAGMKMSLLMEGTMSFVLSLIGMLSAGKFTPAGFLKSFLISFAISLVLGMLVPMKKISDGLIKKFSLKPGTLKARLLEALVSDVVYSPVMTFIMVYMAYSQATAHGAKIPFGPMLLKSECISFVAAFILSFILTPLYTRLVFKKPDRE